MNLFGIANAAIQAVNVNQTITWVQSTGGYTTDAAGHRTENTSSTSVQAQIQGTSENDLRLVDNLNIGNVLRKVYMYGNVLGISRSDQRGGDILQFPETPGGTIQNWKVISVLEAWPTWAAVIVSLQTP